MFQPLGKMVLVKRGLELSVTKGGIIIPESFQERPMQGKIKAIGDEVTKVKVGQNALFAKYSGTDIKLSDGQYLIVAENSLLGLIVPDGEEDGS